MDTATPIEAAPAPAMCVTCGEKVQLPQLRFDAIYPDGRVALAHTRWSKGGICRPVVVAALGATNKHSNSVHYVKPELATFPTEGPVNLPQELRDYERAWIVWALNLTGGVQANAARALGIPRTTLVHAVRRLHIKRQGCEHEQERKAWG